MIKFLSNLLTRSTAVKNETVPLANSAPRIGQLLIDLEQSGVFPFDSSAAYLSGQVVIYKGILTECVTDTTPGELPDGTSAARAKWSVKIVTAQNQVTAGNNLPVSAAALVDYIETNYSPGSGGTVPMADQDTPGIGYRSSDEDIDEGVRDDAWVSAKGLNAYLFNFYKDFTRFFSVAGTPVAGQYVGAVDVNGKPVATWVNTPAAPTLKGLAEVDPNVDTTLRLDGIQQLEQPYVSDIQAIPTVFDTGVSVNGRKVFNTAWVKAQTLFATIAKLIGLDEVLAVRNFSRGTLVAGGFGLFKRGSVPTATRLLGLVAARVDNADADYMEPIEFADVLINGADAMSVAQKNRFISAVGLTVEPPFMGTVSGNRCIEEDEEQGPPPQVLSTRIYDLVDAVDGQILGHPFGDVDLVASYYVLSGSRAYRPHLDAYIKDITAFNFTLDIPAGSTSPLTARLELKPATATA